MQPLQNDRFLRACRREPVDATPVWVMRQAGRYLPEYREVRAEAGSFMTLCQTPELACEVTLQPLRRYDLDASIIFSDILTIPDAMGLGLHFVTGEGPKFQNYVRSEKAIAHLEVPDLAKLQYVYDAIALTQKNIAGKVPLIGFCGSPWTLACYMVDGRSKQGFPLIMEMMNAEPFLLHQLLDVLAQSVSAHLSAQIKAGANAAMLFDSWGGMLQDNTFKEFSLYYSRQIITELKALHPDVPVILFTKGGGDWLQAMAATGCDVLGLDWNKSLHDARTEVGEQVALQGNLNPATLLESGEVIKAAVEETLASFGKGEGHIFNLGHGITPDVPPESMSVLVNAVHEFSKKYHEG